MTDSLRLDTDRIDDPKNTAKSVVFTEDGERVAKEYLRKHFALPD